MKGVRGWSRGGIGGRGGSCSVFVAAHGLEMLVNMYWKHWVGGIFPLELGWVLSPFPQNSFG